MVWQHLRLYRAALLIFCILYLAACALPATEQRHDPTSGIGNLSMGTRSEALANGERAGYYTMRGFTCLRYGWLGHVVWLANPLAFVGVVLLILRRPTGAAAFSAASTVLALLYVLFSLGENHGDVPLVGAWLWLGSLFALTIAAMLRRGASLARKHAEPGAAADGGAR